MIQTSPPPSPAERSLFGGHLLPLRRDPPAYLLRAAREGGDVVLLKLGPIDVYLLSHPDYVREVLVAQHDAFGRSWEYHVMKRLLGEGLLTSEGARHRRHRKLVLPAFHHGRIASYAEIMAVQAEARSRAWKAGAEIDAAREMMSLTLGIVGEALFGEDLEGETAGLNRALNAALEAYFRLLNPVRYALSWLPLPTTLRFHAAKRRLDGTVGRMIAAHRAHGEDRGDLLSMLLLARDEENDLLTEKEVHDQAMTILLAGHETTALALAWSWYLLAQHPEAERRLHEELDRVLPAGRRPAFEELQQLTYTRQVLTESMRLYPPAWTIARKALREVAVGPHTIPAGATVFMSPFVVHRDERFYPQAEAFRPERWTPELKRTLPKLAYFPFGSGPRVCIGEQFAWMEGTIVLAALARNWRLRLVPGQTVRPISRLTLRPAHGIRMRLEAR